MFFTPLAVRQALQRAVKQTVTVAAALKATALPASLRCIRRNKIYILPRPNHIYKMLKYIFLYYYLRF